MNMRGYKKSKYGHNFHYVLPNGTKKKLLADVYHGKHSFSIEALVADMDRAEKLNGAGTTQACMMAVCSERHASIVPHPFLWVEWMDSRAYFVVEMQLGKRAKCIVYQHNDKMAPLFDTPEGRKILRQRLKEEGKIVVHLTPQRVQESQAWRKAPMGRPTGERTSISHKSRGARRRLERSIPFFQEAQLLQMQ
jgi:hypothetical protein